MSPRVVNSPPRGPRTTENLNRLVTHWGKTISNAKSVRLGGVWWTEKSDEAVLHRDHTSSTEGTLWCVIITCAQQQRPLRLVYVGDKSPAITCVCCSQRLFWLSVVAVVVVYSLPPTYCRVRLFMTQHLGLTCPSPEDATTFSRYWHFHTSFVFAPFRGRADGE